MRRVFTKKDGEQWDAADGFPRPVHLLIESRTAGTDQFAVGIQDVPPGSRIGVHMHKHAEEL